MAGQTERIIFNREADEDVFVQYTETLTEPGMTKPMKFQRSRLPEDGVHLQISGTATEMEIVVERSTNDPNGPNPNWAPTTVEPISGDLSAGIAPFRFSEPCRAYWRVRVVTLEGGNIIVVLTGEQPK
ncbi:hypothetical protein [Sphingopyxis flava]|uniref:Uncharacterized protein n=1 Tax=Sphingopyxis flava TaxID=1507287 RepID=A0A1T5ACC8_9SPHN|nr:hypothetical protein [Sphingopyxis flava]SKB32479.1 hypothetical protein SAMN06295937_100383 [Sphingopyxis flava]